MNTGFFDRVYEAVRQIPIGKVATYGQIARFIGEPRKAKIVGWALHKNPFQGEVPCHRVVNKSGQLSGSFAFGGEEVQRLLLSKEGIEFNEIGEIDMSKYGWIP